MSAPATKGFNWRVVTLAVVGGGAVLVAGAQLLARPRAQPTVATAGRPAGGVRTAAASLPRHAEGTASHAAGADAAAPRETHERGDEAMVSVAPAEMRELFRPLVSDRLAAPPPTPAPPPAAAPAPAPRAPVPSLPVAAAPAPDPGPSARNLELLGVVEMDDQVQALLKQRDTGESRYVARGEQAFGFTVGTIKENEVELQRDGKTERVRMASVITIEGPSGGTAAAAGGRGGFGGGFGGFGGGGFGGFGGFGGGRGNRGEGGGRGGRGGRGGGAGEGGGESAAGTVTAGAGEASGGDPVTAIYALPTWTERLKKLDEIKAQLEPARYDRLRKFMADRAAAEGKK